jgi:hypothetical protein
VTFALFVVNPFDRFCANHPLHRFPVPSFVTFVLFMARPFRRLTQEARTTKAPPPQWAGALDLANGRSVREAYFTSTSFCDWLRPSALSVAT